MISPTTRLFGLVYDDPKDVWIAKLHNYALGYNGLDAAYLTFLARPETFGKIVEGLSRNRTTEWVHVTRSLAPRAAELVGRPGEPIDTLTFGPSVSASHSGFAHDFDGVSGRAKLEIARDFGIEVAWPRDMDRAIAEAGYRPCKLTSDDLEAYRHVGHSAR